MIGKANFTYSSLSKASEKQTNFNNLTYSFQSNSDPNKIIGFKCPLGFCKNIKDGYTTQEKAEQN